ncbi:MAG TPA: DinB family protein [Polyangiaceae bacterium]
MNNHHSLASNDATLQTLVTHNAWANRQLFAALHEVDSFESQQGADLIRQALDHVHVVKSIFKAHLQRISHGYDAPRRAVFPSLDALDRESELIDRWYVETVASLGENELSRAREVRFTDGKLVTMTATTMILHVVTHTIHHRGNVDVLMLQAGMTRRRDGIPEFLAQ